MTWTQFSVEEPWGYKFLSAFWQENRDRLGRWHFLFEPHVLVRFQSDEAEAVLESASTLARELGLDFSIGDKGKTSPSGFSDAHHYGEAQFYESFELWEANADFMDAACRAALILAMHKDNFKMKRKFVHLLSNIFGFHYGTETKFLNKCAMKAKQLYAKFGEQ